MENSLHPFSSSSFESSLGVGIAVLRMWSQSLALEKESDVVEVYCLCLVERVSMLRLQVFFESDAMAAARKQQSQGSGVGLMHMRRCEGSEQLLTGWQTIRIELSDSPRVMQSVCSVGSRIS